MFKTYNFSEIEKCIQQFWQKKNCFYVNTNQHSPEDKVYCLPMFPYTSGNLHMGHVRTYVIADLLSRYHRMMGKAVLHPMGWDAFGLPAENAASQHKISAAEWTQNNINNMKTQMISLGLGYDWTKEITTCFPEYYKHSQWIFIQLYEMGIIYRKKSLVYWDPVDCTVLANEQVINGCGWRSGAKVEKKNIEQWFVNTSLYAQDLYDGLQSVDVSFWPNKLLKMQEHWIGLSVGHNITYHCVNYADSITVFTTKAETIFGVSCLAIAPGHPISLSLSQNDPNIAEFISQARVISIKNEINSIFAIKTHLQVTHPITQEILPVWIANFVAEDYATGAVQCVPMHNEIDKNFVEQYSIPYIKFKVLKDEKLINSGDFSGVTVDIARKRLIEKYSLFVKPASYFHLKDWCLSRQRKWGTPIPIIYCPSCGILAEKESNLPILVNSDKFVLCHKCGGHASRDCDTLDTFFESSWYYLRFVCPKDPQLVSTVASKWLPVDYYVGGMEHATLHFLYARLFYRIIKNLGLIQNTALEPFKRVITQGLVLKDGAKMSKSKGNIVNPSTIIQTYGADCVRFAIVSAAPLWLDLEWQSAGLIGAFRFLNDLYKFCHDYSKFTKDSQYSAYKNSTVNMNKQQLLYENINLALEDIENLKFNTFASYCIKILHLLKTFSLQSDLLLIEEGLQILLSLLHPISPHVTQYLWYNLDFGDNILQNSFPNKKNCNAKIVKIIVQINGKFINTFDIDVQLTKEQMIAYIKEKCSKKLLKIVITQIVHIPNKIINFVSQK